MTMSLARHARRLPTALRHSTRCISTSAEQEPLPAAVHRGTAFERRAQSLLQNHLSMSLQRVGGKSDGGVDLLGWWWLPPLDATDINAPRRRLRVLAQCKAEKKKIGPKFIREMEGVLHRYLALTSSSSSTSTPFDPRNETVPTSSVDQGLQYPLVALFISESPYTKSTLLQALSSTVPLILLHLPQASESSDLENWTGSAVWNPVLAGAQGLLGGDIEIRWERALQGNGRPGLWWRNQKLANWTPDINSSVEDVNLPIEDGVLDEICSGAKTVDSG